ncbi:hypothetical protein EAN90_12835 [Vibrio parahaemolyticus]|nr:hypothetical protein [Vibrio parahaemolyticus]EIC2573342.1 hypothetical protein [Vibrio parahaemolyticus]
MAIQWLFSMHYYKSVFKKYFEREVKVKAGFKKDIVKTGCLIVEEGLDKNRKELEKIICCIIHNEVWLKKQ